MSVVRTLARKKDCGQPALTSNLGGRTHRSRSHFVRMRRALFDTRRRDRRGKMTLVRRRDATVRMVDEELPHARDEPQRDRVAAAVIAEHGEVTIGLQGLKPLL